MVFLYGVKDLNERFKKKLPVPIPGEMIVVYFNFSMKCVYFNTVYISLCCLTAYSFSPIQVIVSTGISYGVQLTENYGVEVVGEIPSG